MSMCGENRCDAIFVDNHGVIEGVPGTILEVVGIATAGCEIQRKLAAYEVVYIAAIVPLFCGLHLPMDSESLLSLPGVYVTVHAE